eukprot:649540-Hanusia_phi.AAC.1
MERRRIFSRPHPRHARGEAGREAEISAAVRQTCQMQHRNLESLSHPPPPPLSALAQLLPSCPCYHHLCCFSFPELFDALHATAENLFPCCGLRSSTDEDGADHREVCELLREEPGGYESEDTGYDQEEH